MRISEWIHIGFFLFFVAMAWVRPLPWRRRVEIALLGTAGMAVVWTVRELPSVLPSATAGVLRDWFSAPLMLVVYWQAGRFRGDPNPKFQSRLAVLDPAVKKMGQAVAASPRTEARLRAYLEFCYLLCYPLIPLGVGVLYLLQRRDSADQYWTVVLLSTYLSYVSLPFGQARPPWMRVPEPGANPQPGAIRRLNVWILRRASIGCITFPSAHVAAVMAASFVLLSLVPMVGAIYLWVSVSIAVAAVVGGYHYAADTLCGAALAAAVFLVVSSCFR